MNTAQSQIPTEKLVSLSKAVRISIITMLHEALNGHAAGAMGMADVFTSLYFSILKHDPEKPDWNERDYLLLSAGHICPAWYATLAERGYFDKKELLTLRQLGSRLQGHPHLNSLPGIENTSGPLGQGLSQALGVALSLKLDSQPNRVYCILSDGEHQEGQTWEAYLYAGAHAVNNLTALIDRNHIQIGGPTETILPLDSLKEKIEAFNWNVIEVDGHSHQEIIAACATAKQTTSKPTAIICNTTPGKGVSFMENNYHWHGKFPDDTEMKQALAELQTGTHE